MTLVAKVEGEGLAFAFDPDCSKVTRKAAVWCSPIRRWEGASVRGCGECLGVLFIVWLACGGSVAMVEVVNEGRTGTGFSLFDTPGFYFPLLHRLCCFLCHTCYGRRRERKRERGKEEETERKGKGGGLRERKIE